MIMSFKKDGEVKVYKDEQEVGPKLANKGSTNRYTVDDLVKDSDKKEEVEDSDKEEE
jgi:hypothetical protein